MKTRDIIFQEVESACAFCGQHGKDNLTIHHIDSNQKNNKYDNKIVLCHNCHHRYTNNKGILKSDITRLKRQLMGKTLTQFGINAIKIAYRNKFAVVAVPFLLYHLVDLGYMVKKETQMSMDYGQFGELEITALFTLTDNGKMLYEKWLR